MMTPKPHLVIACGGTGGHLFPGLTVAEVAKAQGWETTLVLSEKPLDQELAKGIAGHEVMTVSSVGWSRGRPWRFFQGLARSVSTVRRQFRRKPPRAVLAMGGFTSPAPVLVARLSGVPVFVHEANAIPGKAVRLLSRMADEVFVSFPETLPLIPHRHLRVTGMPVRPGCRASEARSRIRSQSMGLEPESPTVLVIGGSQGAEAINRLIAHGLPIIHAQMPDLQFIHLAGPGQAAWVRRHYAAQWIRAAVFDFLSDMGAALQLADVAVTRAGASTLAELAALEVPAVMIPYPYAAGDHQTRNAEIFAATGAGVVMPQEQVDAQALCQALRTLCYPGSRREEALKALRALQRPNAAEEILARIGRRCGVERIVHDRPVSEAVDRVGGEPVSEQSMSVQNVPGTTAVGT